MERMFSLDKSLLKHSQGDWTIRHAVEGVQIFGGIGSGKTSGSGRMLALKYLQAGFGGLVLTVKPDEREVWEDYCRLTGRSDDLIVVTPGGKHCFNFLDYEASTHSGNQSFTANIMDVLKTTIQASEIKSSGANQDPFWETSIDMLLTNMIDLCLLADKKLSLERLYEIAQNVPTPEMIASEKRPPNVFDHAYNAANEFVIKQGYLYLDQMEDDERRVYMASSKYPNQLPYRKEWGLIEEFVNKYISLSSKTRSILDFTLAGFLSSLLREPICSLFCADEGTFSPDSSLEGKIIIIDLPVKIYHKVGRDCQIMFKYIWQRAMERRKMKKDGSDIPVFLWADEAQNFLHEHDADYQATARSSLISTVYISQNLPNYYASMGGARGDYRVKSFLGTLATKIFHANADIETNRYASELIGNVPYVETSSSRTIASNYSMTEGKSLRIDLAIRPEQFVRLKTGGPLNQKLVEAYIHQQGAAFGNDRNYIKLEFSQEYKPQLITT